MSRSAISFEGGSLRAGDGGGVRNGADCALEALIEQALEQASDDHQRESLLTIRSSLRTHGLGLAHTHVRLNSSQLHNAIRRQIGLESEPNDPANRRSYFHAINDLIGR